MNVLRKYVTSVLGNGFHSLSRKFVVFVDNRLNSKWFDFPLGKATRSDKHTYLSLWEKERAHEYVQIDEYESLLKYRIDHDWLNELALHTQVVVKNSPLCWQHGRVLYSTLSNWLSKHLVEEIPVVTIWETGTARGFSSICMSKALSDQSRAGRVVTFDVLPHHQQMYWNCIDDFEGTKSRSELISPWKELVNNHVLFIQGDSKVTLPRVSTERIHFAFLDGSHTFEDVMFEFNQVKDYQEKGDIIVFDDYNISQYPGLVKAVDHICKEFSYHKNIIFAHENRGYVIATKL